VICDNYGTHKHPIVNRWLAAHPRFTRHFTPTYSSWLNQVVRHEVARVQRHSLKEVG
jgi:transposase